MPRKKESCGYAKYYMPVGAKEKVDFIVDDSSFYKTKPVWKQKFYHLCDYITQQNFNNELRTTDDYVNIHEETMAKILGVDNRQMATILKHCVESSLLKRDGKMKPAVKTKVANKIVYHTEGKSFGYQFLIDGDIEEVEVKTGIRNEHRFIENRWEHAGKFVPGLESYRLVLSSIKVDSSGINETLSEILLNKQVKKNRRNKYKTFIETIEKKFKEDFNQRTYNIPFDGVIVPKPVSKAAYSYLHEFKDGVIVPYDVTIDNRICEPCIFELKCFRKKRRKAKEDIDESDTTTIARCKRALYHINNGLMIPSRENTQSRVYTTITNLNREFRSSILLDGKKIIGMDIANSQPLLATILIKHYWESVGSNMPADVKQYQNDCERGEFYENFMRELSVPNDLRSEFKKDFFAKVFFSMVLESGNALKYMFMKKYPSCWEAICAIKGGLYNVEYNEFAILLQKIEANIIFDTVNVDLINMGINAFNIFDSIYVTTAKDFDIAERLTMQTFAAYGLRPTIRLEYSEHLQVEPTVKTKSMPEHYDVKPINQNEMKKYTVDELLKTKTIDQPIPNATPTKLQHLKIEGDSKKVDQINKLFQSIQEQDDGETVQTDTKMTNKQIYDLVVEQLKAGGQAINKANVDYLTRIVNEQLNGGVEDSDKLEEKRPYKFVNPYV